MSLFNISSFVNDSAYLTMNIDVLSHMVTLEFNFFAIQLMQRVK